MQDTCNVIECPSCKGEGTVPEPDTFTGVRTCWRCFGDGVIDLEFEFDQEMMKISEDAVDVQLPLTWEREDE